MDPRFMYRLPHRWRGIPREYWLARYVVVIRKPETGREWDYHDEDHPPLSPVFARRHCFTMWGARWRLRRDRRRLRRREKRLRWRRACAHQASTQLSPLVDFPLEAELLDLREHPWSDAARRHPR